MRFVLQMNEDMMMITRLGPSIKYITLEGDEGGLRRRDSL